MRLMVLSYVMCVSVEDFFDTPQLYLTGVPVRAYIYAHFVQQLYSTYGRVVWMQSWCESA